MSERTPPPNLDAADAAAPRVTAALVAEAAVWLSVLHGPERTPQVEAGLAQWLRRSSAHAQAFEQATEIWEEASALPQLERLRSGQATADRAPKRRWRPVPTFAALALVCITAAVFFTWLHTPIIRTQVGEQRVLVLDDGSRVVLNTDTQLTVDYQRDTRQVELKRGEALFEVASDASRPFIVRAGDRRIRALGTAFAVRRQDGRIAVTLVEGKVSVTSVVPSAAATTGVDTRVVASAVSDPATPALPPGNGPIVLAPGERIRFAEAEPPRKDTPPLQSLLAWQRREVALDDTPLAEAVAEMNRYNRIRLVVALAGGGDVRVTGLFRAGDSQSFARAVAATYQLQVEETPDAIRISGRPVRPAAVR